MTAAQIHVLHVDTEPDFEGGTTPFLERETQVSTATKDSTEFGNRKTITAVEDETGREERNR